MADARRPRPWLAGLLSFLQPGLGQLYAGSVRKALGWMVAMVAVNAAAFHLFVRMPGGGVNIVSVILVVVGSHVASCLFAIRLSRGAEARRIRVWLLVVVIWFLVVPQVQARFIRRFLAVEAFVVSAGAMRDTVFPGDRLLSDKLAYGIPNPLGRGELWRYGDPGRGDVVLYWGPDPETVFVKRAIGLPGETIEIVDDVVTIDGVVIDEPYLKPPPDPDRYGDAVRFPKTTIPAGQYFVLGDNRRQSRDSRSPSHGFVPREAIIGRAGTIYFSQFGRDGEIRWSRVGQHVR